MYRRTLVLCGVQALACLLYSQTGVRLFLWRLPLKHKSKMEIENGVLSKVQFYYGS